MAIGEKAARINVDLGDRELYQRLNTAAAENDMTMRDVLIEAITYSLDHQEEVEDELAASAADRVAAESTGHYISHQEVKRRMRARG